MTQIDHILDGARFHGDKERRNVGKQCVFDGCEIERLNLSKFCYLHGEDHSKTARIPQVYFLLAEGINEFKIGTSVDVGRRFEQIQAEVEEKLVLISMVAGSYELEAKLHNILCEYRTHGEWFRCDGIAKVLLDIAAKKGRQGVEAFVVLYGV